MTPPPKFGRKTNTVGGLGWKGTYFSIRQLQSGQTPFPKYIPMGITGNRKRARMAHDSKQRETLFLEVPAGESNPPEMLCLKPQAHFAHFKYHSDFSFPNHKFGSSLQSNEIMQRHPQMHSAP